jgi:hypothetical protein
VFKDLINGKGVFSPKKQLKVKQSKSPAKWDTSEQLNIVGLAKN